MKKILLLLVAVFCLGGFMANAQQRTKLYDGVYIVKYGEGVFSIENEHSQQCISISIAQEHVTRGNNQRVYRFVCNGLTKIVVKEGLKQAVEEVVKKKGYEDTAGGKFLINASSKAANWIYDKLCSDWGSTFE